MFSLLQKAQLGRNQASHYRDACLCARKAIADTRRTDGLEFDNPGESEAKEFSDLLHTGGVLAHQYHLEHKRFPDALVAEYYRRCKRNATGHVPEASYSRGQALDDDPVGTDDDADPSNTVARSVSCRRSPRGKNDDEPSVVPRRVRRGPVRLLQSGSPSRSGRPSRQSHEHHAPARKAPSTPTTGKKDKSQHKYAKKKSTFFAEAGETDEGLS